MTYQLFRLLDNLRPAHVGVALQHPNISLNHAVCKPTGSEETVLAEVKPLADLEEGSLVQESSAVDDSDCTIRTKVCEDAAGLPWMSEHSVTIPIPAISRDPGRLTVVTIAADEVEVATVLGHDFRQREALVLTG